MTAVAVVAHPDRGALASKMAHKIAADLVVWDDAKYGCTVNHRRAWQFLVDFDIPPEQYAVVLEDDAVPVDSFRWQMEMVLAQHPADIVSFYLGTGHPTQWQPILRTNVNAVGVDAHFLMAPELLSCVGYAIRGRHIRPVIKAIDGEDSRPVDEQITAYCRQAGFNVAYTRPSLVNHLDVDTLLPLRHDGREKDSPRRAWKFGGRSLWDGCQKMSLPTPKLVRIDPDGTKWYEENTRVPVAASDPSDG